VIKELLVAQLGEGSLLAHDRSGTRVGGFSPALPAPRRRQSLHSPLPGFSFRQLSGFLSELADRARRAEERHFVCPIVIEIDQMALPPAGVGIRDAPAFRAREEPRPRQGTKTHALILAAQRPPEAAAADPEARTAAARAAVTCPRKLLSARSPSSTTVARVCSCST
jgi:hypothetical protein